MIFFKIWVGVLHLYSNRKKKGQIYNRARPFTKHLSHWNLSLLFHAEIYANDESKKKVERLPGRRQNEITVQTHWWMASGGQLSLRKGRSGWFSLR